MINLKLWSMTISQIKDHERMAVDWLLANKEHPKFNEAMRRYRAIVSVMNSKAEKFFVH